MLPLYTAMDPDHLDIYGTPVEVENAFIQFTKGIKKEGLLISRYGLPRSCRAAGKHTSIPTACTITKQMFLLVTWR